MLARHRALSKALRTPLRSFASSSGGPWSTADVEGIKIASIQDASPTAAISVIARGGARYETVPGVAHALKAFAFKSTTSRSTLRITRETELLGASLSSSLTRDNIILTAEFLKEDLAHFVGLLGEVVTKAKYVQYEYAEQVMPLLAMEYQQAHNEPEVLAIDVAHSLAFRNGLGNSLFASPHHPVSLEQVREYAEKVYTKSNIVVVGSGVSSEDLQPLVSQHFASASSTTNALVSPPSKYYGGESRIDTDAHGTGVFVLALPGGKVSSAHTILRYVLGGESYLKWTAGVSPLSVFNESRAAKVQALHLPYNDTGLFGIIAKGEVAKVREAATGAVTALKEVASKGVKEDELKRAIAKAKFSIAQVFDSSRSATLETIGSAMLTNSLSPSLQDIFVQLEKVKASDVTEIAKACLKAKPTSVAIGDVRSLPYPDEIGL